MYVPMISYSKQNRDLIIILHTITYSLLLIKYYYYCQIQLKTSGMLKG